MPPPTPPERIPDPQLPSRTPEPAKRVLAISAHPDDDTLCAGGTLARLASEGFEVYTLCTNRGEGGEVGEPPLVPSKDDLGALREGEARCAAAALGERDIYFLEFVDPHMEIDGLALTIDATLEEFSAAIASHLDRLRPAVVITHGTDGEYGHPQHRFTHVATRAAIQQLAPWRPERFLTWMARTEQNADEPLTNESDPATETLDVTPWLDRKVAATLCHSSQHPMLLRNTRKPTIRDMVRTVEHLRAWPPDEYLKPVTWDSPQATTVPSDW